jgi:hypothetical protein
MKQLSQDPTYSRTLTHAELTTFREQRPYIPDPRSGHSIPMDFSRCGLAQAYGEPGEIPGGSTCRRRRVLVA